MLEIKTTSNDAKLTVVLNGRLDTTTAPQLESELKDKLGGVKDLLLDCTDLAYISSAGLRVLLATQKTMSEQGEMKLQNVNDTVAEVLEVTGFANILTII
ncbi:MAG: STAS domain-containing protein [Clostridiales bacterium]|nr:STAS domain-containing protein [Clostridiales bacterium]